MTDNNQACRKKRPDGYEPPQAVYLTDSDRAFGDCSDGSAAVGFRVNEYGGTCVTGKWAATGCQAGADF